jgi:hypothetical protein
MPASLISVKERIANVDSSNKENLGLLLTALQADIQNLAIQHNQLLADVQAAAISTTAQPVQVTTAP